jgi:hypothetical protein
LKHYLRRKNPRVGPFKGNVTIAEISRRGLIPPERMRVIRDAERKAGFA